MKKISIITEKNESTDSYIIKNIVIFDDNKAPQIIKYNGIQDLIEVVNFVEKNGINILETGIKPAINNGLVEIIVNKDLRRIAELKAKIVKEQLNSMKINTNEEKTTKDEQFTELKLSDEDREYLEYLKLYNLRLKDELSDSQKDRLNELTKRNVKVLSLEYARNQVLEALDKYKSLTKKEDLEKAREKIEIRKKEYIDLRNKYRNDLKEKLDKIEKENKNDKNEFNKEESYDKKQLSKEDKEYLEYLRLNILRAKKKLNEEDNALLEKLKLNNVMVATVEKARDEVIEASKRVQLLKNTNSKEKEEAEKVLIEKQKSYDELFARYKKKFSDDIEEIDNIKKEVLPLDDKTNEKKEEQEEQKKDDNIDKKEPDPFNERKKVIINANPSIENKKEEEQKNENEKKELDNYEQSIISPPPIKQENQNNNSDEIKEIQEENKNNNSDEIEEIQEENKNNNSDEIEEIQEENKNNNSDEIERIQEENKNNNSDKIEEIQEENKKDTDKKGFVLVDDKNEKDAKGVNPKPNETKEVEVKNGKGENTTIKVNKTSKLKTFLLETLAELLGIVDGIVEFVTGNKITAVNEPVDEPNNDPNNNKEENKIEKKEQVEKKDNKQSQKNTLDKDDIKDNNEVDRNLVVKTLINNYFEQYNVSRAARAFILQPHVVDFLNKYKNEEQMKEVISSLAYGYEANYLATKDNNFRLNEDDDNYLTSFNHDFLCAKAIVNDYDSKQLLDLFGTSNITFEEIKNGFRNYCNTVATYKINSKEQLPLYYLTNGSPIPTDFLDIFNNKYENINSAIDNYLAGKTKIIANLNQMRESIKTTENIARLELANGLFINGKDELGKKVSAGIIDEEIINEIKNNIPDLINTLNKYFIAINNSQLEYIEFNDTYKSIDRFLGISNRKDNNYNQLIKIRNELIKDLSNKNQNKVSLNLETPSNVEAEVKEMIEDTITKQTNQTNQNDVKQHDVENDDSEEIGKYDGNIASSELKQELLEMKKAALGNNESSSQKNQELIKKK